MVRNVRLYFFLVASFFFNPLAKGDDDLYGDEREFYNPSLESTEQISKNPKLKSAVSERVSLGDFGEIAYRGPKQNNEGPTLVLFHGIYGGVSHRAFREILPLLDDFGFRVFVMDLPGTGLSSKPKIRYDIEVIDHFVEYFLREVVREPAHVIAASTVTSSALYVASKNPDLFSSLTVLSPVGAISLNDKPGLFQKLFTRFSSRFSKGDVQTYQNLLTPSKIRYYLGMAYSKESFIDADLIEESQIQQANIDQRWITYAFVSGLIYRSFEKAVSDLDVKKVPTQAIFGDTIKSFRPLSWLPFGSKPERLGHFREINSSIVYHQIDDCGSVLWREKPAEVLALMAAFVENAENLAH